MARLLNLIFYIFLSLSAQARIYDVYRADYVKGPFCAAIGGACASDPDFDNSFFQNPASLEASHENWDYDYDFNKSNTPEPGMGSDIVSESSFMAGVLYAGEKWGYGLSVSVLHDNVLSKAELIDDQDRQKAIVVNDRASTYSFSTPLGYKYNSQLSLGASLSFLFRNHEMNIEGAASTSAEPKSSFPAPTLTFGGIYKHNSYWRYGAWVKMPSIYQYSIGVDLQYNGNTVSYKEDIVLYSPWILNIGASYMPYEDERTFFFELDIIGNSQDAFLQSFDTLSSQLKNANLIEKGREVVVEPRIGWRSAWNRNSTGTYMLGAYYENSRWKNIDGRFHATLGIAYKWTVNFSIFETVELMGGLDLAKNYQQFLLTYR